MDVGMLKGIDERAMVATLENQGAATIPTIPVNGQPLVRR